MTPRTPVTMTRLELNAAAVLVGPPLPLLLLLPGPAELLLPFVPGLLPPIPLPPDDDDDVALPARLPLPPEPLVVSGEEVPPLQPQMLAAARPAKMAP